MNNKKDCRLSTVMASRQNEVCNRERLKTNSIVTNGGYEVNQLGGEKNGKIKTVEVIDYLAELGRMIRGDYEPD